MTLTQAARIVAESHTEVSGWTTQWTPEDAVRDVRTWYSLTTVQGWNTVQGLGTEDASPRVKAAYLVILSASAEEIAKYLGE